MWRRRNVGLKVVVLLAILCILPLGTSWARNRRGGNSAGDVTAAFVGGASMPLTASMGGPSACYSTAASSITGTALQAGGVDPHTASLISSVAGSLGGGIGSKNLDLVGSIAGNLASTEINYQMQTQGVNPIVAGIVSSSVGSGISSGIGNKSFTEGFKTMRNLENLSKIAISEGISYGASQMVDQYSAARPYTGYIGSLGSKTMDRAMNKLVFGESQYYEPVKEYGDQKDGSFYGPIGKKETVAKDAHTGQILSKTSEEIMGEIAKIGKDGRVQVNSDVINSNHKLAYDEDSKKLIEYTPYEYTPGPHFIWQKPDSSWMPPSRDAVIFKGGSIQKTESVQSNTYMGVTSQNTQATTPKVISPYGQ